jgi:aerobic carbon-monoxide dehydrogenase medium subunit
MKPAPFRYVLAESLGHALDAKAAHRDEARFLAGGQSLVPAMNFRLAQPAVLVDLNRLDALAGVRAAAGAVRLGAMTRNRAIERDAALARAQPLVTEAIAHVAHPQIRNRGTIGGNLAHADPASEMPAVMLALGARLRAVSKRGERWIAARDFFQGLFTTALAADELLAEVELPALPERTGTCFLEVARRHGDYPMMGVAAVVTLDATGRCTRASLAYCNAGDTARAAVSAAAALAGARIDDATARGAAATAKGEIEPRGNVHASVAYQRHLAEVLTRRALVTAAERADQA